VNWFPRACAPTPPSASVGRDLVIHANNANGTYPASLNLLGTVVGFSYDVNSWNLFTGTYYDANGTGHGFTAVANQ